MSRSFDAQEAKMSALHARWVHKALASGEAAPFRPGELEAAFRRGAAKGKAKRQKPA